jgi:hypothetical protein
MQPTKQHAEKILSLLSHGLVAGLGTPEPGKMCVEAAVCCALGLPHSDEPPCVGNEVRRFKIGFNDQEWSSPMARANGMRELAIAQLGSDQIDQKKFRDLLWFRFGTEIQPWMWRFLATKKDKDCHLAFATRMEMSQSLEECINNACAYNCACACAYAYAYDYDYDYGYGYGYDYDYGYGYGKDVWLSKVASVGVSVLKELNSPGCAWLNLCSK